MAFLGRQKWQLIWYLATIELIACSFGFLFMFERFKKVLTKIVKNKEVICQKKPQTQFCIKKVFCKSKITYVWLNV